MADNADLYGVEIQLTFGEINHILTNANVWSQDSHWLVYDVRSDTEGSVFDGTFIEIVNAHSGEIQRFYESQNGACCGVASFACQSDRIVFILGPEHPTPDWQYGVAHRQGVMVDMASPGTAIPLDARNLTPPLIPGALRGGSHVHMFSADDQWVSFTYNDALLSHFDSETPEHDQDIRNIGVSVNCGPVHVNTSHPRNHDGGYFSVLVTRTTAHPTPGSDEIQRAFEECWIGRDGYKRPDGSHQKRALAFQGEVLTGEGKPVSEVFVVDIPDDVTQPSPDGPLEGTLTKRPTPPLGTQQRRLTFTQGRKFTGIQGPRHWLRSSPDGNQIAFLMRDDEGTVQLWTVAPQNGEIQQITHDIWSVASAFTWSPNGKSLAYVADNSVFLVEVFKGKTYRLTQRCADEDAPLPLACVFSPDGHRIAYLRRVRHPGTHYRNQIFILKLPEQLVL